MSAVHRHRPKLRGPPTETYVQVTQAEPHRLTRQELQEGDGHAGCGRNVCQLHYQDRQCLDDDVGHLHTADGQGHYALAGTAVDKALFQAVNHLTLRDERYKI